MSTFNLYLHKEWREQRTTLAFLVGLLVVATVIGLGFVLAANDLSSDIVERTFFGSCVAAFLVTVAGDLLGSEARSGRLAFLERLPHGLAAVYRAKLVFLCCGVALTLALAWVLFTLIHTIRLGHVPTGSSQLAGDAWTIVFIALWTFAASAWVPRGTVGLPAAGILFALFSWPWTLGHFDEIPTYAFGITEKHLFNGLLFVAAGLGSWLGFVRGRSFGAPALRSATLCIGAMALVLAPAWLWTGSRFVLSRIVDPSGPGFWCDGSLGGDGRYAFLRCMQQRFGWSPFRYELRVDLEDGSWERCDAVGYIHERLENVGGEERLLFLRPSLEGAQRFLGRVETDGSVVQETDWTVCRRAGLGRLELELERESRRIKGIHDPFRDGFYAKKELPEDVRDSLHFVRVTPTGWVLELEQKIIVFDPDTLERRELDWPGYTYFTAQLSDGRFLCDWEGSVYLCDPADGSATQLEGTDGLRHLWPCYLTTTFLEDEPVLLRSRGKVLVFDPERLRLDELTEATFHMAAPLDSGSAILFGESTVERLNVSTGERKVLFPVE